MSETPNTADAAEEQRALTVMKERLIAHSEEPMWDSAAFDHMGRVAAVMAESGLASDTLLNDDGGNNPAHPKTVVARMLLIAHMARECGANPLMFMQGCSRIGKKIHLEGKLVNAIVRARTGVNLRFQFGRWNTDHIELPELHTEGPDKGQPVDPTFFHNLGERLAVRVSDPEDPERHVEGSVGLWKTDRKGSPWSSPGNWRRQLRYRGAPEWARAYEPGAVLGIYSEADEDLETIDLTPRTSGLAARLNGPTSEDGFSEGVVEDAVAERPKRTRKPREGDAAVAPVEPVNHPTSEVAPTATDGAPAAESAPAASEPATPALDAGAAESSSPPPSSETPSEPAPSTGEAMTGEMIRPGHAEPGQVYFHPESPPLEDGRRITFKDGQRFSSAQADNATVPTYAEHSPVPPDPLDGDDIPDHMKGGPDTLEQAEAEAQTGQPAQDEEPDTMPPDLAAYVTVVEAEDATFEQAKAAMAALQRTDLWKSLTPEKQNAIRRNTWETITEWPADRQPSQYDDVSAFRLWVEAQDDVEALENGLAALEDRDHFKAKPDPTKEAVRGAVAARVALFEV